MPRRKVKSIMNSSGTRYLNVSDLLPESWVLVTTKKLKSEDDKVIVEIRKLVGAEDFASNTENNKADKPNAQALR